MPNYTAPDRSRIALLTINAQRDFTLPGSPLRAHGSGCAVPVMRDLVGVFRAQGLPIFHAVRLYRPDGSNVDSFRRQAVEEGMRVLMPGSFGVELLDEIKPECGARLDPGRLFDGQLQKIGPREWVLYKPRWGAFYGTSLEASLRDEAVNTLVVCGCNFATSGRATIYEAGARDFRVVLVPDAMTGTSEDAICELGRIGIYLKDAECCFTWMRATKNSVATAKVDRPR